MMHSIPADCHIFYSKIRGSNSIVDDIDGFDRLDFDIELTQVSECFRSDFFITIVSFLIIGILKKILSLIPQIKCVIVY